MNFIRKRAILSLIMINLQGPRKDFIREAHKYQLRVRCATPILDVRINPTPIPRVSAVAILHQSNIEKRIVLLTFPGIVKETSLTESHIDGIIDLRESLEKEKLAKLRLEGFGIEIFRCEDPELEKIIKKTCVPSDDENFDKILIMREAGKAFAATKIQRSLKKWIKRIKKSREQEVLPVLKAEDRLKT